MSLTRNTSPSLCLLGMLIAGSSAALATPATTTFTFTAANTNSPLATTKTYTANGITLTAAGFWDSNLPKNPPNSTTTTAATAVNLYYNSNDGAGGSNNSGLGLQNSHLSVNNVIPNNGFVQLTLNAPFAGLQFTVDGVTDYWYIYGTNTASTLKGATLLFDSKGFGTGYNGSANVGSGYTYYDVVSSQDCESLLNSVKVTSTPEPGSFALLGLALGIGGLVRRRAARQ